MVCFRILLAIPHFDDPLEGRTSSTIALETYNTRIHPVVVSAFAIAERSTFSTGSSSWGHESGRQCLVAASDQVDYTLTFLGDIRTCEQLPCFIFNNL